MSSLRDKATKALIWDLVGNYGSQISSFIISIFLARLLSPEDFGLVGMSMVFIGMLEIFKDMGFASALIQNERNSSLIYSSVFYLNIFAGFLLTLAIFFAAPLIGRFYENDTIVGLVRLLSVVFFLNSFNIVQGTILRRDLDFKSLTFRNLTAQLSAGIVAIVFAYYGYGVYALVIQQILAALVSTVLLWKISAWKPKFEFSWKVLKKLSGFSLYVFAASSVNKIIQQLDTLVIGKLFTPITLGYFYRANSLNNLITRNTSSSIAKVFFPALSQIKNENERFEKIYLRVVNMVSSIAILLTGIFFLIGEELIIGLFGLKWEDSVPIFQILILKGFTFPISAMIVNAFMAKGKSKENFHFGNIRKILQLVPFIFAYYDGFYAFLYASVGVAILSWILNNLFAHLSLNISLKDQFYAVIPQISVAIVIVVSIVAITPEKFSYLWAAIQMIIFSCLFLFFLKITKSPLLTEGLIIIDNLKNRINANRKN